MKMIVRESDKNYVDAIAGVKRKTLAVGEQGMMMQFSLAEGAILPLHRHLHEQIGYLLTGKMTMTIEGIDYQLQAGDSWSIPGQAEHGVQVLEEALVVEVFVPIREDYLD